jgi:tricarballylate dehydrogenase
MTANGPYDVFVAGGGNAAIAAALTAAEGGARVLVCEKATPDFRGGNSRHTRDIRYGHDQPDAYAGAPYPLDAFYADIARVADGRPFDHALARLLVEESPSLPAWMAEHGAYWQEPLKGTLALHATNAFFLGGGRALLNGYYRAARDRAVEVLYEAEVVGLDLVDGHFRSAAVRRPSGEVTSFPARALVMASGGFEANLGWLRQYLGESADGLIVRGTPNNDGAGLQLLYDLGAEPVGDPSSFHAVAVDARSPRFDGGIVTRVDSPPFGIVVNAEGRRFADEGADLWPKRYATWGGIIASQPRQIAFAITDSASASAYIPAAYPRQSAATLADVAALTGLPAEVLRATIDEYNEHANPAATLDLSRLDGASTHGLTPPKSNWARPLTRPPYFVHPLRPGITFTYRGVKVDREARVQTRSGGAFENVYAAGEVMAGNVLGHGYLAGLGLTIGHVFGRIAGAQAGRHART